jgi:hypothetical protein
MSDLTEKMLNDPDGRNQLFNFISKMTGNSNLKSLDNSNTIKFNGKIYKITSLSTPRG